jgi:hypothetical protein
MYDLVCFLDLPALTARPFDPGTLSANWKEVTERSRRHYDTTHLGGSMTKDDPTNFKFHQAKLSPRDLRRLEARMQKRLRSEELALLERYRMPA